MRRPLPNHSRIGISLCLAVSLGLSGCYAPKGPKTTGAKTSVIKEDDSTSSFIPGDDEQYDDDKSSNSGGWSSTGGTSSGSDSSSSSGGGSSGGSGAGPILLDFILRNLGSRLGNGLCGALLSSATSATGVTQGPMTGRYGPGFGLADQGFSLQNQEILPGDIMIWEGNTNHNNYPASPSDPINPKIPGYMLFKAVPSGHLSIVERVKSPVEVVVLHQNVNNQQVVQRHTVRLDAIVSGRIDFYRPVKN